MSVTTNDNYTKIVFSLTSFPRRLNRLSSFVMRKALRQSKQCQIHYIAKIVCKRNYHCIISAVFVGVYNNIFA